MMDLTIHRGENKFYIGDEQHPTAEITWIPSGDDRIIAERTWVSDELRGQGIAGLLLAELVAMARDHNKTIIPHCPYIKRKLTGDAQYEDVLAHQD